MLSGRECVRDVHAECERVLSVLWGFHGVNVCVCAHLFQRSCKVTRRRDLLSVRDGEQTGASGRPEHRPTRCVHCPMGSGWKQRRAYGSGWGHCSPASHSRHGKVL